MQEVGAYTTLETLLNAFCSAALEQSRGQTLSFKNRRILDLMGNHAPHTDMSLYQAFLRVVDFVSGMTDSYAVKMSHEMTGNVPIF